MQFFLFWWCFDDHLAAALNMPGLGTLPWWVVLLLGCALSSSVTYSANRS
jgi:hypothetical protein